MKKALPVLSIISIFCCAFALLGDFFPILVGNDYDMADLIIHISDIISCITLILWLIIGDRKHKITALIFIILEMLLIIAFSIFMPIDSISIHKIILYGLVLVPMIANIIFVFYSE